MTFSQYYKLTEASTDDTSDIKTYVDGEISKIHTELERIGGVGKYNVFPSQTADRLNIVDVERGIVVGILSPRGKLISVPVVFGDKVSFAVQTSNGSTVGTIHNLPDGTLATQFRVSPPKPGMKYHEIMGRDDTGIVPGISPVEEPVNGGSEDKFNGDDTPIDQDELDSGRREEIEDIVVSILNKNKLEDEP